MVERNSTTGSARATPGSTATSFARPAGITDAVVNGPVLPAATTHASVPNSRTMRWFALLRLELAPDSSSVIANTSAVAVLRSLLGEVFTAYSDVAGESEAPNGRCQRGNLLLIVLRRQCCVGGIGSDVRNVRLQLG